MKKCADQSFLDVLIFFYLNKICSKISQNCNIKVIVCIIFDMEFNSVPDDFVFL